MPGAPGLVRPWRDIKDRLRDRGKPYWLKALEASLNAFVGSCETACAGGATVDCTILEDLALPVEKARVIQRNGCCS